MRRAARCAVLAADIFRRMVRRLLAQRLPRPPRPRHRTAASRIKRDIRKLLTFTPTTSGWGIIPDPTIPRIISIIPSSTENSPAALARVIPRIEAWAAAVTRAFWLWRILLQRRRRARLRVLRRLAVGQRSERELSRPGPRRLVSGLQREARDLHSRPVSGSLVSTGRSPLRRPATRS